MARGNEGRRGVPAFPPEGWEPEGKYKRLYLTLSPDIDARLDKFCNDEERAKSWVVRKALDDYLSKRGY